MAPIFARRAATTSPPQAGPSHPHRVQLARLLLVSHPTSWWCRPYASKKSKAKREREREREVGGISTSASNSQRGQSLGLRPRNHEPTTTIRVRDINPIASDNASPQRQTALNSAPPPPSSSSSSPTLLSSLLPWTRPYLALSRIDKPIGSWLLFWPCGWSLTLCAQHLSIPLSTLSWNLILFATGALIMRGAGCTINDMWDSNMDKLVQRTRNRPLAAGDITHFQACKFLALQLTIGLAILLQLNWYSILLGASSLVVVVVYPLMKRITYWPQLVLGFAFNWGALLGYSAIHAPPAWNVVLPLYAGSICWTIVYDTIYAHQDKIDDVKAGVKSTALLFGKHSKPVLSAFSISFLSLLTTAVAQVQPPGHVPHASPLVDLALAHPAYTVLLPAIALHLLWQIGTVDLASRTDCWAKFVSNAQLGLLIWIALFIDYLWWSVGAVDGETESEWRNRLGA